MSDLVSLSCASCACDVFTRECNGLETFMEEEQERCANCGIMNEVDADGERAWTKEIAEDGCPRIDEEESELQRLRVFRDRVTAALRRNVRDNDDFATLNEIRLLLKGIEE